MHALPRFAWQAPVEACWQTAELPETVAGWLGPTHFDAYLRFKRVEAEKVAGLSPAELCARYAEVY